MNTPPRKIPEAGLYKPVWREFNRLVEYIREISPVGGRNIQQRRTMNGTLTITEPVAVSAGSEVKQYRLKSVQNDFYTCREWDGTTEGTEDVSIARPFQHRVSNFNGQTIAYSSDGDAFSASFTYSSPTKRVKTVSGTAETQVLIPYFKNDFDIIYAVRVSKPLTVGVANTPLTDTNETAIRLLDLNVDGRAWAKLESAGGN